MRGSPGCLRNRRFHQQPVDRLDQVTRADGSGSIRLTEYGPTSEAKSDAGSPMLICQAAVRFPAARAGVNGMAPVLATPEQLISGTLGLMTQNDATKKLTQQFLLIGSLC